MSGRILIVDDVATNRIVLKVKLAAARYDVVLASNGHEALDIVRNQKIDVILMDVMMPGPSGADVCRMLRAVRATANIPIILITAVEDDETRLEGLEAGADDFLSRPVDDVALLARVRSLLRTREEEREMAGDSTDWMTDTFQDMSIPPRDQLDQLQPAGLSEASVPFVSSAKAQPAPSCGRIGIVCDDPQEASTMALAMSKTFRDKPDTLSRDEALALKSDDVPDVFLIDADLGGRNEGLRLMSELRSRQATRRAGCVILLPAGDSERAATALDLGAADVTHRPVLPRELAMRLRTQIARKRRAEKLRASLERGLRLAVIDPLTGLYNRRYGLHHLERIAARCRGNGVNAGVILLDIDHFKVVNDTHGHPVGDILLTELAEMLRRQVRVEDVVCRIGGEEFMAVLPDTQLEQVQLVAERLRNSVSEIPIRVPSGGKLSVTVSMGVTMLDAEDNDPAEAMARADRALYHAKDSGRNQVTTLV
jgi:two-component system cell cycle response regulator